jgi:tRNA modification GTPase
MTRTYLACLTPPGTAAIATLALRGPLAWTLVRDLAQRKLPEEPEPGRFWLTRLGNAAPGEADEVLVAVKQFAPEPSVELHCHGGREVVRFLEELLAARGVEVLTWQEFELASTGDPLRAAALVVLANAPTVRTAAIALDQYTGAFARAAQTIAMALRLGDIANADRLLEELDRYSGIGRHLNAPWRVVIAGAPNVGKSSLVNALAGYQRSVVSPIPGTTRDVVTTLLALDGWPVEVADTAGWRAADAPLEQEGIARAGQAMASADLCLWLVDASAPPIWPEANLGGVRVVINKIDLPPVWTLDGVDAVGVSAQTGAGLLDLCQAIATWLVPAIPPPGAAVPFTPALSTAVAVIRAMTQAGRVPEALVKLENLGRECN